MGRGGGERRPRPLTGPPSTRLRHPLPLVAGQSLAHLQAHPPGRGPAPARPTSLPARWCRRRGPSRPPAWTFQDLLRNPYDADCFEHYLTAEVARIGLDGAGSAWAGRD